MLATRAKQAAAGIVIPPAFVGFAQQIAINQWGVTVNKPAGTVEGDVMVAYMGIDQSRNFATPAGWTFVHEAFNGPAELWVFRKVAGAGEPANYTFSMTDSTAVITGMILTFRKVNLTTPVEAQDKAGASAANLDAPSVTSLGPGRMLLVAAYIRSDKTIVNPAGTTATVTHDADGSTTYYSQNVARLIVPGGATGAKNFTWTPAGTANVAVSSVLLKPT